MQHCASMKRIVILISGRGSNMDAIVRACAGEAWQARVVAVIADRTDAQGLRLAATHGITTQVVEHQAYADRTNFDAALGEAIDAHGPDVIALAGFMRVLSTGLAARYAGRIVNVHPSLLPAFAGLHPHRRAIEAGCKVAGATVHFVTSQVDGGPIIAQAVVPLLPGDTEATLSARVLEREHLLYPRALRWLVHDELLVNGNSILHRDGEAQTLLP